MKSNSGMNGESGKNGMRIMAAGRQCGSGGHTINTQGGRDEQ